MESVGHVFEKIIPIYNTIRPQMSMQGNTPIQTFQGIPMDFSIYSEKFYTQKTIRIAQNTKIKCQKRCMP